MQKSPACDRTFTVLMTACLAPKPGIREHLRRNNPLDRQRDYLAALRFWLKLENPAINGVTFVDCSGYPLGELREAVEQMGETKRPVEFLSFDFPAPSLAMSYGHQEFQLVGQALEHSTLLFHSHYFIKATGRYIFPDINRLLSRLPDSFSVAVDSKGMRPFGLRSHPLTTVGLALFARSFYMQHLVSLPDQMVPAPPWDRRQFVETMLFDMLSPMKTERGIILRWPCNCEPTGIGANGDNYSTLSKRLKNSLRAASRWVCPNLWI